MSTDSTQYLFKHHPETCDPDDVWGQVKRTVGGKPVSPEHIDLIVDTIRTGLQLGADDVLLDLCCGNGALTSRIWESCKGGLGVDYSEFLIEVANRRFVRGPEERYLLADALDYVQTEDDPARFTKIVCYGAFPYFDHAAAQQLLTVLNQRFRRVTHIFLGQLPDRSRMDAFFTGKAPAEGEADNPGSLLGIWRTPAEMSDLAQAAGWEARCERMPSSFYAAHYRFDAILTRP